MPLLAFIIAAILVVVALMINSNWLLYSRINVQNTADLSARSSLVKIIGDTEVDGRVDRARDLGVRLYNLNIDRPNFSFERERVRFGNIVDPAADELVVDETDDDASQITAVFVDTPASLEQQQVDVFFSDILGAPEQVRIVADATVSTRQIDIMLCLDASRSMNRQSTDAAFPPDATTIHQPPVAGSRWFELKDTVALFLAAIRETNPNARIGLVTFGGGIINPSVVQSDLDTEYARLEHPLSVVIANENDVISTMEEYVTDFPALGLGTSIYDGMEISLNAFGNNDSSRHMILLSDGQQVAAGRPIPMEDSVKQTKNKLVVGRGRGLLRRGTSAVEFAIVCPMVLLVVFGLLEVSRAVTISDSAKTSVIAGAREATVAQTTAADVQDEMELILDLFGVRSRTVTITPPVIDESVNQVTIRIDVPMDSENGLYLGGVFSSHAYQFETTIAR